MPASPPEEVREIAFRQALLPVGALIACLGLNIHFYGGQPHIPLVLGTIAASLVGLRNGYRWSTLEDGMVRGIVIALKAILILLVIGLLIGSWIASGVVPLLIYYGLEMMSPEVFLSAACLICCIVSTATGSSWTTAGTVGVALMAVGRGLGVPLPMVAGAVVSGSYFGDKMSPLSDTTNLAPAVAGSELFEHVKHMMYTTLPGILITLLLYALLGMTHPSAPAVSDNLSVILNTLSSSFDLNPLLLSAPLLVFLLVIFKVPALPALTAGVFLSSALGFFLQGQTLGDILAVLKSGYVSSTGNPEIDALLTRGGMDGMLDTVALIICAMTFGGVMEKTGMLKVLAGAILKLAKNTGSLVATTVFTCIGMNAIAPDQYLSLVVPGRMYRDAFAKANLHPKNLSRILEDAGTLSSPLIAYNTCGAYMSEVLGVPVWDYLPFAFLNLITPLISILFGFTGWTMEPEKGKTETAEQQSRNQSEPITEKEPPITPVCVRTGTSRRKEPIEDEKKQTRSR